MVDAALPHPPTAPSPRSCSQDDIEESTVRLSRSASAVNVSMVLSNGLPRSNCASPAASRGCGHSTASAAEGGLRLGMTATGLRLFRKIFHRAELPTVLTGLEATYAAGRRCSKIQIIDSAPRITSAVFVVRTGLERYLRARTRVD